MTQEQDQGDEIEIATPEQLRETSNQQKKLIDELRAHIAEEDARSAEIVSSARALVQAIDDLQKYFRHSP